MLHTAPIIGQLSFISLVFYYFCFLSNGIVGSNEILQTSSSCYSQAATLTMETHEVVPDIIDVVPPKSIQVKYPSGVEVKQGNELTPTEVKDQPELHFDAEPGALYTLIMSDPDAPSRAKPDFREILHWLIINIPGNDISKGDTKASYIGSGPPKDSGLHRYVFLVFKQPGPLKCTEPGMETGKLAREQRRKFNVRNFAKKYNLGQPTAGNFYQAQYDDYVPILHAQVSQQK